MVKMKGVQRGFRDRDFLQSKERFLFCVIGSIHPADRVISYVKYIPSKSGKWSRGEERFQRIMRYYTMLDLSGTLKFLEKHPAYLYNSHVMGIRISAVPLNRIAKHFKPEEKLRELYRAEAGRFDALQRKTLNLTLRISDESDVPLKYFGVTGSILLDMHQEFSDIDLTVYGAENSRLVKDALKQIYSEGKCGISRLSGEEAKKWCVNKARMYPLTYEEAEKILDRKWNRGMFEGTMFSIHPVKLEEEIGEKYGDRIFRAEGMIKIKAVVSDSSEADFLPSVYKIEDVRILEGSDVSDIREAASYEGLYGGIADEGERIVAYGKLEKVIDKISGEDYHRVLIGSQEAYGKDYIKPLG